METLILLRRNIAKNIKERHQSFANKNKVELGKPNVINLCIVGNSGNNFTKLGFFFPDAKKPNNCDNVTLISFYKEKDTMGNLKLAFSKFKQQLDELK